MIENVGKMRSYRRPTYDGSLWGPDVCRCGDHVDPHRHVRPGSGYSVSIYEDDRPTRRLWVSPTGGYPWASWPRGSYPLVRVPENPGKHLAEPERNGEKWAVLTTALVCSVLGVAVLAAAAYVWLR